MDRLIHMDTGPPASVSHMAASLLPGFLGQIFSPALGAINAKRFELDIIAVLFPEIPNHIVVLARCVDNQVVVEPSTGVVALRHPDIFKRLTGGGTVGPEGTDKRRQALIRFLPADGQIRIPVGLSCP